MSEIINGVGRIGWRQAQQSGGGGGYTTRTQAFATATGIVDTTILNALNTFDLGLISNGLDTKMKAVYPFVGGTATTHKFNFMNPVDSNSAFRLQFFGGGTHSSTGYKPNGTNAYANTFLTPNGNLLPSNSHISYYSRTNSSGIEVEIGVTTDNTNLYLLEINTFGNTYAAVNQNVSPIISYADTDSRAFYLANRTASNLYNAWRNSTKKATATTTSAGTNPNIPILLGAYNENLAYKYYSTKECAFASAGLGLTDGEASTFYSLVNALQTSLSRQV
jgi:hypothetical protein